MADFESFASQSRLIRHLNSNYSRNLHKGLGKVRSQVNGFSEYRVRASIVRRFSETMAQTANTVPESLADVPANHVGANLTPQQVKENADRDRLRKNLKFVGSRRTGRLSETHTKLDIYPIKVWDVRGEILPFTDDSDFYFDNLEIIPITDEMESFSGRTYPARDDYEFQVFPILAPLRGIQNHDYIMFKRQVRPPEADTQTFADGTLNWTGYDFWQIRRIVDEPKGFMVFFTLPISRMY